MSVFFPRPLFTWMWLVHVMCTQRRLMRLWLGPLDFPKGKHYLTCFQQLRRGRKEFSKESYQAGRGHGNLLTQTSTTPWESSTKHWGVLVREFGAGGGVLFLGGSASSPFVLDQRPVLGTQLTFGCLSIKRPMYNGPVLAPWEVDRVKVPGKTGRHKALPSSHTHTRTHCPV